MKIKSKIKMEENTLKPRIQFKYKQVIVIRTDITMSKGKAVAQACHVAVKAAVMAMVSHPKDYEAWDAEGHAKIVCKVNSLEELGTLKSAADDTGLPNYLVTDFGYTELPAGTATALAIGPAPVEQIDPVTKHLKLM